MKETMRKAATMFAMLFCMMLVAVPAAGQQKKVAKKSSTTVKKNAVRKKAVSQPVTIQMDEPCIAGGAIAFNGIPINLSDAEMASELTSQGFKLKKDEYGNERWHGKAFGVEGEVYVGKNPAIVNFMEKKYYSISQVRKRVTAYKNAFEELSGCRASNSSNSIEGGKVTIPINGGHIEINYANCDEVNFESKDYALFIVFSEQ